MFQIPPMTISYPTHYLWLPTSGNMYMYVSMSGSVYMYVCMSAILLLCLGVCMLMRKFMEMRAEMYGCVTCLYFYTDLLYFCVLCVFAMFVCVFADFCVRCIFAYHM